MTIQLNEFKNPSKKYRPWVRWWWPGMGVEIDELKREIQQLDEAGFGGFEVQPFLIGGSGGLPKEVIHRMAPNPYFFDILQEVFEDLKVRNMQADFNIGSSWPPGGTQIDKPHSLKTMLIGTKFVKGKKQIVTEIPPYQLNAYYKYPKIMSGMMGNIQDDFEKYKDDFKPVATVAVRPILRSKKFNYLIPKRTPLDASKVVDLSDKVNEEGQLTWNAPKGTWQIFTFYGGPTGMTPMSDAKSEPDATSLVVDILDKESVSLLIDGFMGKLNDQLSKIEQYLGTTYRALFTDSQEIADEWFWSDNFFDKFIELRGYDVKPYLPCCFVPNRDNQFLEVFFQNSKPCFEFRKDKVGERIRFDWLMTLSDIWAENYIKNISQWGEKYGLMHRIQTYGVPVDLLKTFAASDIPETESLFAGSIDFFKLAGSVGTLYDKPFVSSETFSWMKKDLMTTPLKWKVACDRTYVAGVNQNIFHGWSYQPKEDRKPGHYPWRGHGFSEDLSPNSLYWEYYPILNQYATRIQYLMSLGKTRSNIAMFYQEWNYTYKNIAGEDNEEGTLPGYDADPVKGPIAWFKRHPISKIDKQNHLQQKLGHQLMEYGYYYTHVNDEILCEAVIENGKLKFGSAEFEVLVFPNVECISFSLANKLLECINKGIHIIFVGKCPERQSGFLNYKENDPKIKEMIHKIIEQGAANLPKNCKKNVGKYVKSVLKVVPQVDFHHNDKDITYIEKGTDDAHIFFLRSGSQFEKNIEISFNPESNTASEPSASNGLGFMYSLNPWNGSITEIKDFEKNPLKVKFAPYESKVFIMAKTKYSDEDVADSISMSELSRDSAKIEIKKRFESFKLKILEPKCNEEYEEQYFNDFILKDWRDVKELNYCSGPGIYSTTFELSEEDLSTPAEWILNLGKLHDFAKVNINKTDLDVLLVPPYSANVTKFLHSGVNYLTIKVTGSLQNRYIGYGKTEGGKWGSYAKRELAPVGLIGPVELIKRS